MKTLRSLFFIISIAFSSYKITAQNITGSWEGVMAGELLTVNIIQSGDELCGYTSDVLLNDRSSWCKAYFKGSYNRQSKVWTITGYSFIANSGNHVFMSLKFWKPEPNNDDLLKGAVTTSLNWGSQAALAADYFYIKKVSGTPKRILSNMPVCLEMPKNYTKDKSSPEKDTRKKEKSEKKRNKRNDTSVPVSPDQSQQDTLQKSSDQDLVLIPADKDNPLLKQQMESRKKNTVTTIVVDQPEIELNVYDNGQVDNDTVSIFFDGKIIASKQQLTDRPLTIRLKLDENRTVHEVTMFAENLGSIPPNTALIIVNAGGKRYELRSSASMEENAVLYFEYRPKQL